MVAVALIGGAATLAGAGITAYGASQAADKTSKAAMAANQLQQQQYEQTRADLAPFVSAGTTATNKLTGQLDALTAPFSMTQEALEATPGYQFNLAQGLKATQNSAAARGLGMSGAAMKGAAAYATGLADSTYKSQFDIDQQNKANSYNKLLGVSQVGANAANQVGSYGQQSATAIGNNLIGAANTQGAATMAGANAFTSGINGMTNAYMQNNMMQTGMYGGTQLIGSGANAYRYNPLTGQGYY